MRTILLIIHISSGSLALGTGPVAMLVPKRPGLHPRLGIAYQVLTGLLCVSAIGLAALTPAVWWLGVIAVATWAAALAGWQVRRKRCRAWLPLHISFMCGSYISLTTALLVVNLGLGDPAAWILPTIIGTPLIARRAYLAVVRPPVKAGPGVAGRSLLLPYATTEHQVADQPVIRKSRCSEVPSGELHPLALNAGGHLNDGEMIR
jgi:hypothetical protein